MAKILTEDEIRDQARDILGLKSTSTARAGVGQVTTFNQLGFPNVPDKPDGWYLPSNKADVALVLEAKASNINLGEKQIEELRKNVRHVKTQYGKVVGILYNGENVRVLKDEKEIKTVSTLQNLDYYIALFHEQKVDKQRICKLTMQINNCLHNKFGIKDLYLRMGFTACALVAKRYNAPMVEGMDVAGLRTIIKQSIANELDEDIKRNQKLRRLVDQFERIEMNFNRSKDEEKALVWNFIRWVTEVSDCVNSDEWRGEDVVSIFFNEFNRYRKKSDAGQIFTPGHIADFVCRLLEVNQDDRVLDGACGSGTFLTKAMSIMIEQAGGERAAKAVSIKQSGLYGIEYDGEIFSLACANMLIHKDGKTNLEQMDCRSPEAASWIKWERPPVIDSKTGAVKESGIPRNITKVMMNPPFEDKYGCLDIIENVLDSVPIHTRCAFILPEKKLEKSTSKKRIGRILQKHRITEIIKLPENLFFGASVTTSLYLMESGVPQGDNEIFGVYMANDGLVTVKNQGRQDTQGRWEEIEKYWLESIKKRRDEKYGTVQWIKPSEHLSYQVPVEPFSMVDTDFMRTSMEGLLCDCGVDNKKYLETLADAILYSSDICVSDGKINISIDINKGSNVSADTWKEFRIKDVFAVSHPVRRVLSDYEDGDVPFVASGDYNNGIVRWCEPKKGERLDKGKCVTVSPLNGRSFYQKEDFLGRGGSGSAILMLRNDNLNELNGRFIAAVLNESLKKHSFCDQLSIKKMENHVAQFPAKPDGTPDWDYMDDFMRNMKQHAEKNLACLMQRFGAQEK